MKLTKSPLSLAVLAALYSTSSAYAQTATPPTGNGDRKDVSVVVVTGIAGSIESSQAQKKNAINLMDVITAEDIGKFPDTNLSESLQRVPGVTLERNNVGDGSAINLRGLGPQFTIVTINGMTGVASGTDNNFGNSNGSRGFNFEILPSELFTRAAINKTIQASQIEGGLAGVVELETPRPFDNKGFHFSVGGKGNNSNKSGQIDPSGSMFISNTWGREFGIAASIAGADARFRSDSSQGGSYRAFSFVNTGTRASDAIRALDVANGPRFAMYDDKRKTIGGTITAQWRPTRELEFVFDALHGKLSSKRNITRDDAATESGVNIPVSYIKTNNVISSAQFTGVQQRIGTNYQTTEENMSQVSFQTIWHPEQSWTIKPYISTAKRKASRTADLYSFRLAQNGVFDPGIVSYNIRGDFLDFSTTHTDFSSNPKDFLFNVFIIRPSTDTDTEKSAKLDVEKEFDQGSWIQTLKFGVRTSKHEKDTIANESRLTRSSNVATTVPPNLGSVYANIDFNVAGGKGIPSSVLIVNPDLIPSVFFPNGKPVAGTSRVDLKGTGAQGSYNIKEDTNAAYVSGLFEYEKAHIDAGVRYVRTEQTSSGYTVENVNLPTQRITPISYKSTYSYVLPNLNLRYDLSSNLILRSALSKSLTRPDLNQLAPSETVRGIDQSGGVGTRGNPNLKPYTSKNMDLGLEWYIDKAAMMGFTIFRKDIDGFIDTRTFTEIRSYPRQADSVIVSGPILFTQPVSGASAKIDGAELVVQSRFTFLPAAWMRNFGGILNVSYTKSSANFADAGDVRSSGLPGLSKNSYNATIYYDDGKFDGRISYAWRSRHLAQFSDNFGIPRFRDDYGQFDVSASYKVTDRFSIQFDVLNLTKSQFKDKSTSNYYPYGVIDLDRRIMIGARYAM